MNVTVNIFAIFGALVFFGLIFFIIKDAIDERRRKHVVKNYLSDDERDEYLRHDAEMERFYILATDRRLDPTYKGS